jgi:membrane-associated phospholipid phosphatase
MEETILMGFTRRLLQRLRSYDILTLGYLFIVLVFLAVSPHPPSTALRITGLHTATILGILLVAGFSDRSRVLRRLHDFYPTALFIGLFSELTRLSTILFPYWIEPLLIKFDRWLFGGSPQSWVVAHLSPAAVEFFALAYCSYYLIIPGTVLFVYRKSYPRELIRATSKICLTMYVCYVLFMLIPARGPHHALAGADPLLIKGWIFTGLLHRIQGLKPVEGAAFPSSHVAVAWVAFFILRRRRKGLSWPAGLVVGMLTISVVVMGYHFSLDALGGAAFAFGLDALMKRRRSQGGPGA